MNRHVLGASGVELSVLGLGTYWAADTNPSLVVDLVAAAVDVGINWVDTGEAYYSGGNESNIAAALREFAEVQVASKVAPAPEGSGLHPDEVRRACEASMRRLGRDVIDVYWIHRPDPDVPIDATWTAMAQLVADGLVRAIGLSQYGIDQVLAAHSIRPVDVVQDGLSMVDYLHHRDHFAACTAQGIAGVVFEPLGGGILSGTMTADVDMAAWEGFPFWDRLFPRSGCR